MPHVRGQSLLRRQKIDRVIEFLTHGHLWDEGGYPHDHEEYAGRVFVADLDDGKERAATEIRSYGLYELSLWYDRAAALVRDVAAEVGLEPDAWPDNPCRDWGGWGEAFRETAPRAGR
jgi:hypothetical protein